MKTSGLKNISQHWKKMSEEVNKIIEETHINIQVPKSLRFEMLLDKKRFEIKDKQTKLDAKDKRKVKVEQHLDFNAMRIIFQYIKHFHWKVQNTLFFWFTLFVHKREYEKDVLELLKYFQIEKIHSRASAIKFFGLFSKFFKFLKHFKDIHGFDQYRDNKKDKLLQKVLYMPPEIFIDLDAIFGYCECTKEENTEWDKDFVGHLFEWVTRDTRETLFNLDLTFDFKLALEHQTKDETPTQSEFTGNHKTQIYVFVETSFYEENLIHYYTKDGDGQTLTKKDFKEYIFNNIYKNKQELFYPSYRKKTANFFNFAAQGGVKDF